MPHFSWHLPKNIFPEIWGDVHFPMTPVSYAYGPVNLFLEHCAMSVAYSLTISTSKCTSGDIV